MLLPLGRQGAHLPGHLEEREEERVICPATCGTLTFTILGIITNIGSIFFFSKLAGILVILTYLCLEKY